MSEIAKAKKILYELLRATYYPALLEKAKHHGLQLSEECRFVPLDVRENAIDWLTNKYQNKYGPVGIYVGDYGVGKTTVLYQLMEMMRSGELTYGDRQLYPIRVELQSRSSMRPILEEIFGRICDELGEDWFVEAYNDVKERYIHREFHTRDTDSYEDILVELLEIPVAAIQRGQLNEYLEHIALRFRQQTSKAVALIIDELEKTTKLAERPGSENDPVFNFVARLVEQSVHSWDLEWQDEPAFALVFNIIDLDEFAKLRLIYPDTEDRYEPLSKDLNLNREQAKKLMMKMLREYSLAILDKLGTAVQRSEALIAWKKALASNPNWDDPLYSFPFNNKAHNYLVNRVLAATETGKVVRFRSYQFLARELVDLWSGQEEIDIRFLIRNAKTLRNRALGSPVYLQGIQIGAILDDEELVDLLRESCQDLSRVDLEVLSSIVRQAILESVEPRHAIQARDAEKLELPIADLDEDQLRSVFEGVAKEDVGFLSVLASGDVLQVDVEALLDALSQEERRDLTRSEKVKKILNSLISDEDERLVRDVAPLEVLKGHFIADGWSDTEFLDESQTVLVLAGKRDQHYTSKIFLGFEEQEAEISKLVTEAVAYDPGIVLKPGGRVCTVVVYLSNGMEEADTLTQRLTDYFSDQMSQQIVADVAAVLSEDEPFAAFKQALKIWAWISLNGQEDQFADVQKSLKRLDSDVKLSQSQRSSWIAKKLGFSYPHGKVESICRLMRVLRAIDKLGRRMVFYEPQDRDAFELATEQLARPPRVKSVILKPAKEWNEDEQEGAPYWIEHEDFLDRSGEIATIDRVPNIQDVVDRIETQLKQTKEETLDIRSVEELVFGPGVSVTPQGQALLHLLLTLGANWGKWVVNDDLNSFSDITIELEEPQIERLRQQVQKQSWEKLKLCVVGYAIASENEEKGSIHRQAKELADFLPKITKAKTRRTLEDYQSRITDIEPPKLRPAQVDISIVESMEDQRPRVGEFVASLSRVSSGPELFAGVLSRPIKVFLKKLERDIEGVVLTQKLRAMYVNWKDTEYTGAPKQELLLEVEARNNLLRQDESWETTLAAGFEKQLTERIQQFAAHFDQRFNAAVSFVETEIADIIAPSWRAEYSERELEDLRSELSALSEEIEEAIDDMTSRLSKAIDEVTRGLDGSEFGNRDVEARRHRDSLTDDKTALKEVEDILGRGVFRTIQRARDDLEAYTKFWDDCQAARTEELRSWKDQNPHIPVTLDDIKSSIGFAREDIVSLMSKLSSEGIDILRALAHPEEYGDHLRRLLAIFAAAAFLTREEQEGEIGEG